jgi:hypothetical protein
VENAKFRGYSSKKIKNIFSRIWFFFLFLDFYFYDPAPRVR